MTAAVESLARQYPGRYRISTQTTCQAIWDHNPHVHPWEGNGRTLELQYPLIHESHHMRTGHFMGAFVSDLGQQLGIPIQLQVNRPALYLSDAEKNTRLVEGPYFVLNAGVKSDYTAKLWPGYQAIVDHFRGQLPFVQIGEKHHRHEPLKGAVNMIGKTTPRQLFQLVHHSLGGIGPTTFLQHVHAALGRFYVCILGGREPKWWADYPTQTTFSTMGQLPCCRDRACWKSRTVPLGDGDSKDNSLCTLPILSGPVPVPACMQAITPDMIIQSIETYLRYAN